MVIFEGRTFYLEMSENDLIIHFRCLVRLIRPWICRDLSNKNNFKVFWHSPNLLQPLSMTQKRYINQKTIVFNDFPANLDPIGLYCTLMDSIFVCLSLQSVSARQQTSHQQSRPANGPRTNSLGLPTDLAPTEHQQSTNSALSRTNYHVTLFHCCFMVFLLYIKMFCPKLVLTVFNIWAARMRFFSWKQKQIQ